MKKRIDIYSFFSNAVSKVLNDSTCDYKKYTEVTPQPLSIKLYELYLYDIPVFRFSLVSVWTIDYCLKNKIRLNFYRLNDAGGRALGLYVKELINLPNYSKRKALKDAKIVSKKIDKIHNRFWNSRIFIKISEKGKISDFLKWYIKFVLPTYKVKSSDDNVKSALSDLLFAEAETIISVLTESMEKELEKVR